MCGNNNICNWFSGNNWWWIIILMLLFCNVGGCGCDNSNYCNRRDAGCGCCYHTERGRQPPSRIFIFQILAFCIFLLHFREKYGIFLSWKTM